MIILPNNYEGDEKAWIFQVTEWVWKDERTIKLEKPHVAGK